MALSRSASRVVACLLGIVLCAYALHVEWRLSQDPDYAALCDISDSVSCSEVIHSPYGKGFGLITPILGKGHVLNVPNSAIGLLFYVYVLFMGNSRHKSVALSVVLACAVSVVTSLYLAYVLIFLLKNWCVLCTTSYILNAYLFVVSLVDYAKRNGHDARPGTPAKDRKTQ